MCQPLPTGSLKRTDGESWGLLNQNSERGLILEVELEYPKELHHLHNCYSCAVQKIKIKSDMLSPYCLDLEEKFKLNIGQVKKLITTISDKQNYVLHYRNLQL